MALSKQSILKHAGDFKAREVHIPAWADESGDDVVLVRGMTLREFELNGANATEGTGNASVIAKCVVDETGGRVFTKDDVNAIAELPIAEAQKLSQAIVEASGLNPDEDTDKAIESAISDAEGNSDATAGDGSSSD